jgi:Asp-tRNA(Asn)/Glu-tRNA(Gln) amidotransferase A subunit family amidase
VPVDGVVPLAPSFDTVGLLTRDVDLLHAGARVLLDPVDDPRPVSPRLTTLREAASLVGGGARLGLEQLTSVHGTDPVDLGVDLAVVAAAFRTLQSAEAWRIHGAWVDAHWSALGADVAARFRAAAALTGDDVVRARDVARRVTTTVLGALTSSVLVLPAAPGAAPPVEQTPASAGSWREHTLELTCVAGLAGAPVVVAPLLQDEGLPLGAAFVGPPGADLALIEMVRTVFRRT